jgi:hypothetical protein
MLTAAAALITYGFYELHQVAGYFAGAVSLMALDYYIRTDK